MNLIIRYPNGQEITVRCIRIKTRDEVIKEANRANAKVRIYQ